MKKLLIITLWAIPFISSASSKSLDYCATVGSWAAQQTIDKFYQKNRNLDPQRATSTLLVRTALKEQSTPVTLGEWGALYTQTIKISLPYVDDKAPPITIIASSIISAEECSMSEPAFVEMAP